MKKFYIICLLTTFGLTETRAQFANLLGDTTEWCIAHEALLVLQDTAGEVRFEMNEARLIAYGDTLIGTDTFKIIYELTNGWSNPIGFIREDTTGKAWTLAWGMPTPVLTFDFGMNMGDSIYLDIPPNNNSVFADGYYKVDSVGTFNTVQGPRKYIRLHNALNTQTNNFGKISKIEWVESLGSLETPLYLISTGGFAGYAFGWYAEACNTQNLTRMLGKKSTDAVKNYLRACIFQNPVFTFGPDSCEYHYWGSVADEMRMINNLLAYPNPSAGKTTIDLNGWFMRDPITSVVVMDISGQTILTQKDMIFTFDEMIIPEGKLKAGTYVVYIRGKETLGRSIVVKTQ
jgi:hypothetical protein